MRVKSSESARTICNDDGNTTTSYWKPGQLVYSHISKQSIAKPVLEKLLNENLDSTKLESKFEDYVKWIIENNILQKTFQGWVQDSMGPFARLSLAPDAEHKYGINTEYFILRKKNGQTIDDVYLVEKASFSFDKFSVGHLLRSIIFYIIFYPIREMESSEQRQISGIEKRQSDFALSYIRVAKLGDDEKYTIEQIPDLPGDYNDYFC